MDRHRPGREQDYRGTNGTVVDIEPPTITAPSNITVNTDSGKAYATNVVLGTAAANDNSGTVVVSNNAPAQFPLGQTTVTWTATDPAGLSGTATQTVTVVDKEAPSIQAPANVTIGTDAGKNYATNVDLGSPAAADNSGTVNVSNNAPAQYPLGQTIVTWTATDAAGNKATAAQTVTVVDQEPPSIQAPAGVTVNNDPGKGYASGVALGTATAADNSGAVNISNDAPAKFPIGETTVTWTATDAAGNKATATQIVSVADNEPPTIQAPSTLRLIPTRVLICYWRRPR